MVFNLSVRPKYVIFFILSICNVLGLPDEGSQYVTVEDGSGPTLVGTQGISNENSDFRSVPTDQKPRMGTSNIGFILSIAFGGIGLTTFFILAAIIGFRHLRGTSYKTSKGDDSNGRTESNYSAHSRKSSQEHGLDFLELGDRSEDKHKDKSYYFDKDRGLWGRSGFMDEGSVSSLGMVFYRDIEEGASSTSEGTDLRGTKPEQLTTGQAARDTPWFEKGKWENPS